MNIQNMKSPHLKSSGENGLHNKIDWINEAESKLISALALRDVAKKNSFILKNTLTNGELPHLLKLRESTNKSSFLLLGYAIELLLKSGVVSLLIFGEKHLLEKKVKNYSHDLLLISEDLHLELNKEEKSLLTTLGSFIINETRYPVKASSYQEYCAKVNNISSQISNEKLFSLGIGIFEKIKSKIKIIDGSVQNPKLYNRVDINSDGYVTFRVGGALPAIFIIKYSEDQISLGKNNLSDLKILIEQEFINNILHPLMLDSWECADFYETCNKKGLKRIWPEK